MRARHATARLAIPRGVEFDTHEATGSNVNYVYSGFQAKHPECIDVVKQGAWPCFHFADTTKNL
jgi:hypothetical protein